MIRLPTNSIISRLTTVLLSLTLISCAQTGAFWEGNEEQKPQVKVVAPPPPAPVNPFLAGLSEREIRSIKNEAWREYGRFWRGVATRSRYVRQPLLESLKQVGAPVELQMVPVVESSYNPYVVSSVGAAGLWQLMPVTARDLKVRSDRYVDGRRDIRESTRAAARYLTKQYRRFGNWPMAFAAYHLGPRAVKKRLKRRPWTPAKGLRHMPLPPITKTYIRHILGLIALHEAGNIQFPTPYPTRTLTVKTPIDLDHLHELAELPENQIFRFNPKLKLKHYYDQQPGTLSLRISKIRVSKVKKHIGDEAASHLTIETKGESMIALARHLKVTTYSLQRDNPGIGIHPPAGTRIRLPAKVVRRLAAGHNPLARRLDATRVDVAFNQ